MTWVIEKKLQRKNIGHHQILANVKLARNTQHGTGKINIDKMPVDKMTVNVMN
jgi:hypothetical protein